MTDTNDRATMKALIIAAVMILILFIGLFVGYRWGVHAAHRDNAAKAAVAAPTSLLP